MLTSTATVGRKVVNANDETEIGVVAKITVDKKARNAAFALDSGAVITSDCVRSLKKGVYVNGYARSDSNCEVSDKNVYDTAGKYLGQIGCVAFNKNMKIRYLEINGEKYPPSKVQAADDVVLIKTATIKSAQPPKRREVKIAAPIPKLVTLRHTGDFSFLIGKRCDKNITNFQGEIMVKENAVITKDVLRQAKVNGKLTELSLHCR